MENLQPPSMEELGVCKIYTAHNTVKGVLSILSNPYPSILLRAGMQSDGTIHGATEALQAQLVFIEERVGLSLSGQERVDLSLSGQEKTKHLGKDKEKYEMVYLAEMAQASSWGAALQERWRAEPGDSSLTDLTVQMQGAALQDAAVRGAEEQEGANDWVQLALRELGCVPPEGDHFTGHSTRKGACTCTRAAGALLEKCFFMGGWSQLSSGIHSYTDPTAVPDE
ncbi:hypothetical protein CYMTET_11690 [Cymbomonas tetramitiformis]|uniref:Uncharacterized protein n=1 Tax=Cymbomonas tetramitiformis TaxID=36881 RepID=A0AAE0GLT6_9CHLO|nr:hypothetical protein CYMTET_54541 [Cymbomonas tetramitiformis]KAK3280466.1 hypothetical protein CYMTET_11690 [Cymbomonas tetramitiformis]